MNKPFCLGLSISEVSKTVMYDLWFDYAKPKYGEKAKLSYIDTGSFKVYIKTEKICVDITKDVEIRFHTSKYELDFEDHKQCLEANQLENEINKLEQKNLI